MSEEIRAYYSLNHRYKGYTYYPVVHLDEAKDTRRVVHEVLCDASGEKHEADFTPYCYMSKMDFQNYVDLEFPKRVSVGPLSSTILRRLKSQSKIV